MQYYIATFYSHFGAIRFKKEINSSDARLMPVPRTLSSSCGTCVRFLEEDDFSYVDKHGEIEQIVREKPDGYECIYRAKES